MSFPGAVSSVGRRALGSAERVPTGLNSSPTGVPRSDGAVKSAGSGHRRWSRSRKAASGGWSWRCSGGGPRSPRAARHRRASTRFSRRRVSIPGRPAGSGEAREPHGAGLPGAVVPFGRGRGRATETGAPAGTATREATRRGSELAGERPYKRPCGGARRLGAADGGTSMTAVWADVERAVSRRSGRGPRNGPVSDGDLSARGDAAGDAPCTVLCA